MTFGGEGEVAQAGLYHVAVPSQPDDQKGHHHLSRARRDPEWLTVSCGRKGEVRG